MYYVVDTNNGDSSCVCVVADYCLHKTDIILFGPDTSDKCFRYMRNSDKCFRYMRNFDETAYFAAKNEDNQIND